MCQSESNKETSSPVEIVVPDHQSAEDQPIPIDMKDFMVVYASQFGNFFLTNNNISNM